MWNTGRNVNFFNSLITVLDHQTSAQVVGATIGSGVSRVLMVVGGVRRVATGGARVVWMVVVGEAVVCVRV